MQPCLRTRCNCCKRTHVPDTQCDRISHVAHLRTCFFEVVQNNAQIAAAYVRRKGFDMAKRKSALIAGLAVAACVALGGAGCGSGQHEIIDQGKDCASCHSGGKQTYEVAAPAQGVQSTGQVNVSTSASRVIVCKPIYISEDGSKFVPEQQSCQNVSDGRAVVNLSEGTWAVCVDQGGTVKAKLVTVSSEAAGAADVEL